MSVCFVKNEVYIGESMVFFFSYCTQSLIYLKVVSVHYTRYLRHNALPSRPAIRLYEIKCMVPGATVLVV